MAFLDIVLNGIGDMASLTGRWRFAGTALGGAVVLAATSEMSAAPRVLGYALFVAMLVIGAAWEWRDGASHI